MEEENKVEFLEEEEQEPPRRVVEKARGEIIAWLMKIGIVKTEKGANKIMLFVALLGFILMFYILSKFVF